MNAILMAPGFAVLALYHFSIAKLARLTVTGAMVQYIVGASYLNNAPRSYLSNAYDFTRAFLFKWTVNWRFVGQKAI